MSAAKVLITGLPNSGKTSLVKNLTDCLVIARDGKPFPFKLPHVNVPDFITIKEVEDLITEKINTYEEKFGKLPKTVVVDSVSRIFTDIETSCSSRFSGFDIWTNINKEINSFVQYLNSLLDADMNVVIIAHAVWDEKADKFIETCKGNFAKVGGFLSTVDYAVYIELVGSKRLINYKGKSLSRTLVSGLPDKQSVEDFNLENYLDIISTQASAVTEEWSI